MPISEPPRDASRIARRNKFSAALVDDARVLFERRLKRPVSTAEARNLLGDLTDYMWVLIGWETRREHRAEAHDVQSPPSRMRRGASAGKKI